MRTLKKNNKLNSYKFNLLNISTFVSLFFVFMNNHNFIKSQEINKGIVKGQIYDSETNIPIPSARVSIIIDNKITKKGGISDVNGYFKIKDLPLGRISLMVSSLGYESRNINNIIVTAGKELNVNITMVESVIKSGEVEVVYDRKKDNQLVVNDLSVVSARAFNFEDTKKYAGSLGDPSRMVANFAGVTGANDSRNDIIVRGNSPSGVLWQLEGLNIPNPNHFGALTSTGGPVSMLNNNNIDKSDFLTGAFTSQYGNATAGAFDLRLRNGNYDKSEFISQIGFNGFELGAEGPFSSDSKSSYLINYRYSTLSVFNKLGLDIGTGSSVPDYQDINYKFNFELNPNNRIAFFGIAGISDVAFLGNEQDTSKKNFYSNENQNTIVDYSTIISGLSWESILSNNTNLKITAGYSQTNESFSQDSISLTNREIALLKGQAKFKVNKFSLVGNIKHKFDSQSSLVSGFYVDNYNFNLFNKDVEYNNNTVQNLVRVNVDENSTLTQLYTQYKYKFTDLLTASVGLHFQYYDLSNKSIIEPRANIQYILDENNTFSLGYGLHSQIQNFYTSYVQSFDSTGNIFYTNKNLDFTKSHHLVGSYELSLVSNWRIKLEGYYQSLFDVPISFTNLSFSSLNVGSSFAPSNEENLFNGGSGSNVGGELTIEKNFTDGFYMLFTSSIFDSKYKGRDGIERNTAFNTNYVVNLLAGQEIKFGDDVLSLNLRLSTTGGRYLTPIDLEKSKEQGTAVFRDDFAFSERQTPYFRADIKIGYKIEFESSTMEFSLDLQNISNNQNIFSQNYNSRLNQIQTEYQQGFFPIPTFRYTF